MSVVRRCCRHGHPTGGQVISEEVGQASTRSTQPALALADKVVVTKDETTIVNGGGSKEDLEGRIAQIKAEIDNTDLTTTARSSRSARQLSGGGRPVGAATEVELKEKKHRIEDAVSTTKAAIEGGVVAGGGVTLLRAQAAVDELVKKLAGGRPPVPPHLPCARGPDQADRRERRAEGGVVVERCARSARPPRAQRRHRRVRDLVAAGIIDAAKVTCSALQNAASIAALFLTTEAVVADARRRLRPAAPPTWAGWT